MAISDYFSDLFEAVGSRWNQFWFTTADSRPLAALRIATGILLLLFLLDWSSDLSVWFGDRSVVPVENMRNLLRDFGERDFERPSLWWYVDGNLRTVLHMAAVAVAAAFTLGIFTRVSTWLAFIMLLSYVHRAPPAAGLVEVVLAPILFYLGFAAAGEYWSLDALRSPRKTEPRPASVSSNIALRLIQLHFAALVLSIGLARLAGPGWWDGEAIWSLAAQTQSRPLNLTGLRSYEMLVNAWTHSIVLFEILFPLLIFIPVIRPLVIAAGVVVWGSLILVTGDPLFSFALIAACAAYLPGETFAFGKSPERVARPA